MKPARWVVGLMALGMMVLAGCGKDKAKSGDGGGADKPKVAIAQDSPKAVLETLHRAAEAKDMAGMIACMEPSIQEAMRAMIEMPRKMQARSEEVSKLVAEKIGEEQAKKVRGSDSGGPEELESPLAGAVKDGKVDWDMFTFKEEGDTATVTMQGERDPLPMKKIDGKWYVCMPGTEGMTPEQMNEQVEAAKKMTEPMLKALDEVEKRVKDGTLNKDNFDDEYMKIMLGGFGGMMEGMQPATPAVPEPEGNGGD